VKQIKNVLFLMLVSGWVCPEVFGGDWPQFRGPNRDGKSAETALLKKWPEDGPQELWSIDGLGEGFASVAVADGIIYTTGLVGKDGVIFAFDLDGKLKWKKIYGPGWTGSYKGTRTTPTIDGDRLYLMSAHGRIACYNARTGDPIWYIDTLDKFHGENIRWGMAESVLIDSKKVICTPGGQDASVVALDKMNGKTLWTSKGLSERSAYCSPILVERGGTRLLMTMIQESVVGLDITDGKLYWRIAHQVDHDINAVSPAYENGMVYITNGYKQGGMMFELAADGKGYEKKWVDSHLDVHHGGVVLVDGDIHGASTRGQWMCLELATGRLKFQDKLVGKGSVIWADDRLYCYGEKGTLGLVKITPGGYEMVSSFKITKGSGRHWAHPAISNGRLYLRHGEALMAYDIKSK